MNFYPAKATLRLPDGQTREVEINLTQKEYDALFPSRTYRMGCVSKKCMVYKVGDRLIYQGLKGPIVREIVDIRPTGYGWKYIGPEYPADDTNYYLSENSADPFFENDCWSLYRRETVERVFDVSYAYQTYHGRGSALYCGAAMPKTGRLSIKAETLSEAKAVSLVREHLSLKHYLSHHSFVVLRVSIAEESRDEPA